jgi:alpha-L-fucosidase 2
MLPAGLPARRLPGRRRARGGFEVDMQWETGRLVEAAIHSRGGKTCRVRYGDTARDLTLEPGQTITLDGDLR